MGDPNHASNRARSPDFDVALLGTIAALAATQLVLGLAQLMMVLAAQSRVGAEEDPRRLLRDYGWYYGFQSGGEVRRTPRRRLERRRAGLRRGLRDRGRRREREPRRLRGDRRAGGATRWRRGLGGAPRHGRGAAPTRDRRHRHGGRRQRGVGFALSVQSTFLPLHVATLAFSATSIGALFSIKSLVGMLVRPALRGMWRGAVRSRGHAGRPTSAKSPESAV